MITVARCSTGRPTLPTPTPPNMCHLRLVNAALVSMCDEYLGRLLDLMDELDLWRDTLLIVNTDHGFPAWRTRLWAKCVQPFYEEIAHTPALHLGPALAGRRRAPPKPGADHRPARHAAGVLQRAPARRYAGRPPARDHRRRPPRARSRSLWHVRRAGKRHRLALCLHARQPQPAERPALRVHPHAHPHGASRSLPPSCSASSWPGRSPSPKAVR